MSKPRSLDSLSGEGIEELRRTGALELSMQLHAPEPGAQMTLEARNNREKILALVTKVAGGDNDKKLVTFEFGNPHEASRRVFLLERNLKKLKSNGFVKLNLERYDLRAGDRILLENEFNDQVAAVVTSVEDATNGTKLITVIEAGVAS